ncbi:lipoate protein ligase C-terminal domain-containing protein [[Eubacterium] cellulosolvens]
MHEARLKVIGGKLIRISFLLDDNKISDMKITGDFFLYPEEGIEELERRLNGIEAKPKKIQEIIVGFFNEGFVIIGAKPDDFTKAILIAKNIKSS